MNSSHNIQVMLRCALNEVRTKLGSAQDPQLVDNILAVQVQKAPIFLHA